MPKIIIKDKIVDDKWEVLPKVFLGEPPVNKLLLLPMKYWLEHSEDLRLPVLGIWIDSDEEVEDIGEKANMFPVIAINFPSFTDGRGFTAGRLLRELFYLKRCGFDAFQLREGTDLEEALKSLNDFSVTYQGDADDPNPLFRRDQ